MANNEINQDDDANDPSLEMNINMEEFGIPIESLSASSENPIEPESSQTELEADAPIPGPLDEIKRQLDSLSKAFESKLKYDAHKNKIIDDLHQTLQEHRQGLLQKYVLRIFSDVLKVVDDIRKFIAHYNTNQDTVGATDKLLKFLETTASDLEDLFSWEGIIPFTCEGDQLDPSRQRVTAKVPTHDPEKDKKIAGRVRPGYELDGKVIRHEMVSVFVYQEDDTQKDEKANGQTS